MGRHQHKMDFESQAIDHLLLGTINYSCGILSKENVLHKVVFQKD